MGGDRKMKGKIQWALLVIFLGSSVSFCGIYLSIDLLQNAFLAMVFALLLLYFTLHLPFGPLDWYLICKLYLKIKEVIR